jgi:plastocyanin
VKRLALALGIVSLTIAGPAASAEPDHGAHGAPAAANPVSMLASAYAPAQIDVLVGDTVRWVNNSIRPHTVTADAGAWSSSRILVEGDYRHRFDAPGTEPYYCKLHVFMRGVVGVHRILLERPREPGAPGRVYSLHGRAALPAGSTVSIEADTGTGFQPAAVATVEGDGSFSTDVSPRSATSYRAVAGDASSPAVQVLVLDRKLSASVGGRGRSVVVNAAATPASPGATVVLQLRLKHRFGWWPVARAKLDGRSRARFALRLAHRYPARVVLTLADGATQLALSRTLRVGPSGLGHHEEDGHHHQAGGH